MGSVHIKADTARMNRKKEAGFTELAKHAKTKIDQTIEKQWELIDACVPQSSFAPPTFRAGSLMATFFGTRVHQRYGSLASLAGDWNKHIVVGNLGRTTFPTSIDHLEVRRCFLAGGVFPYGFAQLQASTTAGKMTLAIAHVEPVRARHGHRTPRTSPPTNTTHKHDQAAPPTLHR